MSNFARVDENGIVVQVIVAEQDFIDTLANTPAGHRWIQTSYNTFQGVHTDPVSGEKNTKPPLRKNFAGRGYTYDETTDAFIPPRPNGDWDFDSEKASWEVPATANAIKPSVGVWQWDGTEWREKTVGMPPT